MIEIQKTFLVCLGTSRDSNLPEWGKKGRFKWVFLKSPRSTLAFHFTLGRWQNKRHYSHAPASNIQRLVSNQINLSSISLHSALSTKVISKIFDQDNLKDTKTKRQRNDKGLNTLVKHSSFANF